MKTIEKALVCGAGGFIGSHLVKKSKKEVFVTDNKKDFLVKDNYGCGCFWFIKKE